jgi:uncharacterized protein YdeI (YjbR/CyaY-like superfamily)
MDADRFARIEVQDEAALWAWLGAHHAQAESVWLVTWKAAHRDRHVGREAVLDALIAHGWIDGRRMVLDEERTMQLIGPRRQMAWAASYKARSERLIAEGRMHPAGLRALEAGRASGLWTASDPVDALEVPPDLEVALKAGGGRDWWAVAAPSYRRNVLRWIAAAKGADTRARRVATVAGHAAEGRKMPQY